jgi:hypothetical protein
MARWIDLDDPADAALVETLWADAPFQEGATRALLDGAQRDCATFASVTDLPLPADDPDGLTTAAFKQANILQARGRHRSTVAGGEPLGGEFPITIHPLDWAVKQLLRPALGLPGMF